MSLKKDNLNFHTTRRFAPLFGTQFLGALNDNMFKTALFVMISFYGLGKNDLLPPSQMLNLGAMLFILPYFLFSALSGQLSNKFDKAVLARWIKLLEIIIMAVAAYGFYIQSAPVLRNIGLLERRQYRRCGCVFTLQLDCEASALRRILRLIVCQHNKKSGVFAV